MLRTVTKHLKSPLGEGQEMELGHWQDQTVSRKLVRRDGEASVDTATFPRDSDPELASGLTVHPVLEIISVVNFHLLLPVSVHRGAKISLKC